MQKRNLIAWDFYNPTNLTEQVDVIISHDLQKLTTTVVKTPLGNIQILSRQDLIAMKKESGRPQDLEDIKALGGL